MKIFLLFTCFLLLTMLAEAQTIWADSLRVVLLQEVKVTARQKSQQQQLYDFFSANRSATTEDILSRLPELSLLRRGSYGMEPVIRSYNSGQINLLLDGMRIHGACTDKMDPASIYIEPVNLAGIDVRTSGGSSLQGSSIGGSINMKLAEAACHEEANFSGAANSGYNTAARAFYQSLNLNYSGPGWGLRATGTYRNSHEYRDGSGKKIPFSQYEKVNYSLHGKWMLGQRSYLKVDLLADDGWNIGYPALPMDAGYANARIGAVSIVTENGKNGWQRMEAKLYANRIVHYMDDTHRPDVPMHMDMPGESLTSGMYAEAIKNIGSRQQLVLRADAAATSLKASMTMYQDGQPPMYMLTWPNNRQLQSGLAAQYLLRIDSCTRLHLNARGGFSGFGLTSQAGKDQFAVFGYSGQRKNYFTPALSAQLDRKLYRNLQASLSLGISGRTPTASELFGFYLFNQFDGYDYTGNPALKQESAQQAELTLCWQPAKLKLQATGYVSRVSRYIIGEYVQGLSAMTIGAKGVKRYENIDKALLAGGEGSLLYTPFLQTKIMATIKYAWAQDDKGDALPLISPLRSIGSLRQHINRLWVQAELEAAAAQHRVSRVAQERTTGAFSLCHFRMGYEGKSRYFGWQLNAGVENILDAYYREHPDWGNIARPGRNFYLQLGIGF